MKKHFYEEPEIDIVRFEAEDVITTSGFGDGTDDNDDDWSKYH